MAACCRQADRVLSSLSGCAYACQWPIAFSAYSSLRLGWAPIERCRCGALQKNTAQGPLVHQAVLKIPHQLLGKMSAQQQASIIAEIAKELQQLAGPAADMDDD